MRQVNVHLRDKNLYENHENKMIKVLIIVVLSAKCGAMFSFICAKEDH